MPRRSLPRTHTALLGALTLHLILMWYSASLGTQPSRSKTDDSHSAMQVSLMESQAVAPLLATEPGLGGAKDEPATGSPLAGEDSFVKLPAETPKPAPMATTRASRVVVTKQPNESERPLPEDALDYSDLDAVFTAANAIDSIAAHRPRAARTELLRPTQLRPPDGAARPSANQKAAKNGRQGTGSGDRRGGVGVGGIGPGGSGGFGAGGSGGFGGAKGHFHGQVCFIEPGTKALRELGLCEVQGEFFTDVFNISPRSFTSGFPGVSERSEWFAILYTGVLITLEPGSYRFRVVSDDGAILRIDGEVVVDNDGQHGPISKSALKFLARGSHQLELRYFQGPRTMVALQVFVTPPERPEQLLQGTL